MSSFKFFDVMSFDLDDSFHKLSPEEMKKDFPNEGPNAEAYISDENDMRILVYYKQFNPIMLAIADKRSMRSRVNYDFKQANPSYELSETYAYMVDGKKYYGLRYEMDTSAGHRLGDTILLTRKRNYVVVSASYPKENETWAIDAFSEMLATIKF